MNIDQLSQQVYINKIEAENPGGSHEVMIDPATLAMIFTIVKQIIGCIKKRKEAASNENVSFLINNPSGLDIIRMRWIVRRVLGFWRYRKEGNSIVESLLRTGGNLTLGDIKELL